VGGLCVFQSYGGLRGAVAFCLVAMLEVESIPHRNLFQTTVFVVVIFTVFIQVSSFCSLVVGKYVVSPENMAQNFCPYLC